MITEWQWDEERQTGTDYTDEAEVQAYERRMSSFRDLESEGREALAALRLPAGAAVLEIGCGTGWFARMAAAAGLLVTACDISPTMLRYCEKEAKRAGLQTLATRKAGFLTMDFPPASFDAVVSSLALHHLPDAWKLVALRNAARVLKEGGQLLLRDVVFALREGESPTDCFERFVQSLPEMRANTARHVAREFSTYDWIMEGLLHRAGFLILSVRMEPTSLALYHCLKGGEERES